MTRILFFCLLAYWPVYSLAGFEDRRLAFEKIHKIAGESNSTYAFYKTMLKNPKLKQQRRQQIEQFLEKYKDRTFDEVGKTTLSINKKNVSLLYKFKDEKIELVIDKKNFIVRYYGKELVLTIDDFNDLDSVNFRLSSLLEQRKETSLFYETILSILIPNAYAQNFAVRTLGYARDKARNFALAAVDLLGADGRCFWEHNGDGWDSLGLAATEITLRSTNGSHARGDITSEEAERRKREACVRYSPSQAENFHRIISEYQLLDKSPEECEASLIERYNYFFNMGNCGDPAQIKSYCERFKVFVDSCWDYFSGPNVVPRSNGPRVTND